MIKKTIKIFATPNTSQILSFHNRFFIDEEYEFVYTTDIQHCDVLVVFAEGGWNNIRFDTDATKRICFTGEPSAIYSYSPLFFNQFTDVVTSQSVDDVDDCVKIHKYCQALNYLVGYDRNRNVFLPDEAIKTFFNRNKTKLISAICSDKAYTEYHRKRREFLYRLKNDIPELELFGSMTGHVMPIKDDALREYKYTIAIENCRIDDYWTEKIADPIYSLTQPIYCGCRNIERYFDGIRVIDIDDYEASLHTIKNTINGVYDIKELEERRDLMLTKYSFHNIISDILNELI